MQKHNKKFKAKESQYASDLGIDTKPRIELIKVVLFFITYL